VFATADGGLTWNSEIVLSHLPEIYGGVPFPSTLVDFCPNNALISSRTNLTLRQVGSGGKGGASRRVPSRQSQVSQRSPLSPAAKGGYSADGKLLATIDGGINWTDITPSESKAKRPVRGRGRIPAGQISPFFWSPPFRSVLGTVRIPDSTCVTPRQLALWNVVERKPFFRFRPLHRRYKPCEMVPQYKPDSSLGNSSLQSRMGLDAAVGRSPGALRM